MVKFNSTDRLKTICLEVLENVKENTRTMTEDLNNFPIGYHFFCQIDRIKAMGEKYHSFLEIVGRCNRDDPVNVPDSIAETIIYFAYSYDYDIGKTESV